jgi:hypothetical protein
MSRLALPLLPVAAPVRLAVAASGTLLLVGMLLGVWKWRQMLRAPSHAAHPYVDIAHRAALLYAFACLVLAALVAASPFPAAVNLAAVVGPIAFFAAAVATYARLGAAARTDNQFRARSFATTTGMWILTVAEVAGAAVALAGFLAGTA